MSAKWFGKFIIQVFEASQLNQSNSKQNLACCRDKLKSILGEEGWLKKQLNLQKGQMLTALHVGSSRSKEGTGGWGKNEEKPSTGRQTARAKQGRRQNGLQGIIPRLLSRMDVVMRQWPLEHMFLFTLHMIKFFIMHIRII